MRRLKSEAGYTLIEAIAFMGVISMLAVSIITLVNNMLDKYRMSRVTQQIVDIQKNIDFRFSAAENFKDLTTELITKEKIVPGDMVAGNKIYHAYKGEVTIKSERENSVYEVSFTNLPYNACVELAMVDWLSGYNSNVVHIKVNQTYFTWQGTNSSRLPMEYGHALAACADNRNNVITWQFQ